MSPSAQTTLDAGETASFIATVSNDSTNQGVTWQISGPACSGAACGSFSNATATSATYNPPAAISGSLTVSVTATSAADRTKSASSSVVVNPAPSIVTSSLPNGTVGTAYSTTLEGTGGTGSLTWSLASGSAALPAGLSLSAAGTISGTPTASGATTFTVKATDSAPQPLSVTAQLSLTVSAAGSISVALTPSTTIGIDQGQTTNLSSTVTNDVNSQGVTWSVSGTGCSGAACGTLTNTTITSAIYNAPASVSSALTVLVTATSIADATKSASTTVVVSPSPSITTASLPNGTVSVSYSSTLTASGGTGNRTWSLVAGAGSLPAGLTLSSSGTISGTPTSFDTSTFSVKVTDSAPRPQSVQLQLSIIVNLPPITVALSPATSSAIDQGQNLSFTATLTGDLNSQGVTWSASGTGCAGATCGTFTNTTTTTAT